MTDEMKTEVQIRDQIEKLLNAISSSVDPNFILKLNGRINALRWVLGREKGY